MKGHLRRLCEWLLLAALIGAAGFAVAGAQPAQGAPQYVRFEPIIVPVFIDDRTAGLLAVHVTLEARSREARARLVERRPRLVDAYTSALIAYARLHVDPLAPVDVGRLQSVLRAATMRAVPDPDARVLVLDAVARAT